MINLKEMMLREGDEIMQKWQCWEWLGEEGWRWWYRDTGRLPSRAKTSTTWINLNLIIFLESNFSLFSTSSSPYCSAPPNLLPNSPLYPSCPLTYRLHNHVYLYFLFSQRSQAGTPLIYNCILRPMILHAYCNCIGLGDC